jgi:hypothetical protein
MTEPKPAGVSQLVEGVLRVKSRNEVLEVQPEPEKVQQK